MENSWGEDRGEKGYLIMSADWFKEFVFEIVVDKSIVRKEVLDVFEQTPIVLPVCFERKIRNPLYDQKFNNFTFFVDRLGIQWAH